MRRSAASIRELLMKSAALSRVQNVPAALAFTRAAVAVALWCSAVGDGCRGGSPCSCTFESSASLEGRSHPRLAR